MEVFVKEWRFYKKILFLSAPIILQQILRVMVDLCDSMMLSRVGEIEMAAVTQAQQLFFIFYTIVGGMSVSACVLISQYWGRRDLDKIKDLYAIGIRVNFCFAFFILFLVLLICSFSLPVLGNQLLLLSDAVDWFCSPTARRFSKGSNHSLFVTLLIS